MLPVKSVRPAIICLLVTVFIACTDHDLEQGACVKFNIPDTYEYPIPFQSDAWFELRSLDDRVNACQIPDDVLRDISTEALLETLLQYPLLLDFGAFNVIQDGFDRFKNEQKGFEELYKRSDFFEAALDRYEKMNLQCKNTYPPFLGNGESIPSLGCMCLEFVLFQDDFIDALTEEQELIFFKSIFRKLEQKNELTVDFKDAEKWISTAILGKIMFNSNFTPFKEFCDAEPFIEFFVHRIPSYQPASIDLPKEIFSYAEEYIAAHS